MIATLLNLIGFKLGWTACVLGAARGVPWLGPVVVAVVAGVNWSARGRRRGELVLFLCSAAIGYAADSAVVLAGLMSFEAPAQLGGPASLWMAAMWVNLAATLNASMRWLSGRYLIAAVLGAVAGPLAYVAGARLGAVQLAGTEALLVVGLEWMLCMPLLVWLADTTRHPLDAAAPASITTETPT